MSEETVFYRYEQGTEKGNRFIKATPADLEAAGWVKHPENTIVCLCGSTRFSDAFRKANFDETLKGHIVLTIGCDFKSDDALNLTQDDKIFLDNLHKRKIDIADDVFILNVDGYIGESTRSELEYAIQLGKNIRYLVPLADQK